MRLRTSIPWPGNCGRRGLLATAAALALVAGLSQPASAEGKLTFWGGLIFSDAANQLLTDTAVAWGEANDVDVEVVMINQNETVQRVSAAVESGTMPDVLDVSLDLLLHPLGAGRLHSARRSLRLDRRGAGRLVPLRRHRLRHHGGRRRAHRHALRRQRQPDPAAHRPARAGGLHRGARHLGRPRRRRPRRSTRRRSRASASRSPTSATATCRSRSCSPSADASPTTPARPSRSSPTPPAPISHGSRTRGTAASSRRATRPGTARATTRPTCPGRRRSSPTPARSASPPRTRTRSSSRRPTTRRCRRGRRA